MRQYSRDPILKNSSIARESRNATTPASSATSGDYWQIGEQGQVDYAYLCPILRGVLVSDFIGKYNIILNEFGINLHDLIFDDIFKSNENGEKAGNTRE